MLKQNNKKVQLINELDKENEILENIIANLEKEIKQLKKRNKKKETILNEIEHYKIENEIK